MPGDRTDGGDFPAELPELTGEVRALRPDEQNQTLAAEMVPVADDLRQLYTDFGIRPYRVFLVHVTWSGGRRGQGAEQEVRREILPTPQVRDMGGNREVLRSLGRSEEGGVRIEQISPKYTEDDLLGRTPDLRDPAAPRTSLATAEFFYELVESRPSTPAPARRRYVPDGAPTLSRDGFAWSISLQKQDYDRGRRGELGRL